MAADDLKGKVTADEYHKIAREALLEYLRDRTTVEERKAVFKAALSEWLNERFAEFGWLSFKALMAVVFSVFISMWVYFNHWK